MNRFGRIAERGVVDVAEVALRAALDVGGKDFLQAVDNRIGIGPRSRDDVRPAQRVRLRNVRFGAHAQLRNPQIDVIIDFRLARLVVHHVLHFLPDNGKTGIGEFGCDIDFAVAEFAVHNVGGDGVGQVASRADFLE